MGCIRTVAMENEEERVQRLVVWGWAFDAVVKVTLAVPTSHVVACLCWSPRSISDASFL